MSDIEYIRCLQCDEVLTLECHLTPVTSVTPDNLGKKLEKKIQWKGRGADIDVLGDLHNYLKAKGIVGFLCGECTGKGTRTSKLRKKIEG